jgi:hypothetical protein
LTFSERIARCLSDLIVNEREEPLVWVRTKSFVLSPGAPIPLVNWPDDNKMIRALTKNGSTYRIAFTSLDYPRQLRPWKVWHSRSRLIPTLLVPAKEYCMPRLPPTEKLLRARRELDNLEAQKLLERLNGSMLRR